MSNTYTRGSIMDCSNPDCINLQKELQALKSTGYDVLKQTGSWQSCGATHEDLSRKFCVFFDHEVYSMTETLQESSVNEDVAREILSNGVQESYEICRREILQEMMKTLERVVPVDITTRTSMSNDDESLYDATRAYGLLLSASGLADSKSCRLKKISKQVHDWIMLNEEVSTVTTSEPDNIQEFAEESSELSWDLLTTVPPLVSSQPKSSFIKEWHEKEVDSWTDEVDDHELVYYRPILFRSSAGDVAQKAIVGNRKCEMRSSDGVQSSQLEEDRITGGISDENKVLEREVLECESTNQPEYTSIVKPCEVEQPLSMNWNDSHTLIPSNILQKQPRVYQSSDSIWHQGDAHKFTSTHSSNEAEKNVCISIPLLIPDEQIKPKSSCYDRDIGSVEAGTQSLTRETRKPTDHEFQTAEMQPVRPEGIQAPGVSRGTSTLDLVIIIIIATLFIAIFSLFCVHNITTQPYQVPI